MKLLESEGVTFKKVDYYKEPFTTSSLRTLLGKAGLSPRDVLRKRAKQYKELGLGDDSVSDADLLKAIVAHPDLLERPIMEVGDRALLARPVETALTLV